MIFRSLQSNRRYLLQSSIVNEVNVAVDQLLRVGFAPPLARRGPSQKGSHFALTYFHTQARFHLSDFAEQCV